MADENLKALDGPFITNERSIKIIKNCGAIGYGPEKIAGVLDLNPEYTAQFLADFKNPDSVVRRAYEHGRISSQYLLDLKLFELAQNGDLKALEQLEKRKRFNK